MDKPVRIPEGIHVMTAGEIQKELHGYDPSKPVVFATGFSGKPKCVLGIYEDDCKQVWIDIGPIED